MPKRESKKLLLNRYELVERIGQGGIGTVWRVYDSMFERPLAVKFLHQRYSSDSSANLRMEWEALITGALQHPGIPPVHDFGKLLNGSSFFTMKLVNGQTLSQILKDQRSHSTQHDSPEFLALINTFELIAQTVAYAHSQRIILHELTLRLLQEARKLSFQLIDREYRVKDCRIDIGGTFVNSAAYQQAMGLYDEALDSLDQAEEYLRLVLDEDKDHEWRNDFGTIWSFGESPFCAHKRPGIRRTPNSPAKPSC